MVRFRWFSSSRGLYVFSEYQPSIFRGVFPVVFSDPLATRARCPAGLLQCNHAKRLTNPWGNKGTINAPKEPWILWGSKKYDRKDPYNPQPSTLIVFLVLATGARDHVEPYQAMAVPGMCKQTNKIYVYININIYACICLYTCIYIYACICVYTCYMYINIYKYIHTWWFFLPIGWFYATKPTNQNQKEHRKSPMIAFPISSGQYSR